MADDMDVDDFNGRSAALVDWLKQNGTIISNKIELADLRQKSAGRGVVAVHDIAEDEELFSLPRSILLTVENSEVKASTAESAADPWLSIILAMAYEYQLGRASKWYPYFQILPTEFDTLMYWSEDELEHLKGSGVVEKIGKEKAEQTFTEDFLPAVRHDKDEFKVQQLSNDDLLMLFHRMGSTIMAYAFDLERPEQPGKDSEEEWEEDNVPILPKAMIPLADMLNADADRNNAKLFYESDRVVMRTIKPVAKGEELFNDYDTLPRAELLRRYGYVTDHYAKCDEVDISADFIKEVLSENKTMSDSDIAKRFELLQSVGVEGLEDGFFVARSSNPNDSMWEELTATMNGLTMSMSELEALEKKDKPPKPALTFDAAKLLHKVLLRRREQYSAPTQNDAAANSEAMDLTKTETSEESASRAARRKNMAVQVIAGEQEVLQEAITTVEAVVAGFEAKAKGSGEDGRPAKRVKR